MDTRTRPLRWLAALAFAAALAACGGGGGGGGTTGPAPTPDARNGDYAMYAADAREYTLSLDFDADTYRVTGNGQDLRGTIVETNTSGKFDFDRAPTASSSPGAPRFALFSDTVVGSFRFPGGTVPFIAARSFVTTLAEAAGTYNFVQSTRDTAAASNNAIFTGELLASGTLNTCHDAQIFRIALCPAASLGSVTVTVAANGQFTATTGTGFTYPFRVAKVGSDRVFLRASPSTVTERRFMVGTIEAAFANGNFEGANTNGDDTMTWITTGRYDANWTNSTGNYIKTGTQMALNAGIASGPAGIIGIDGGVGEGFFFAMRNSEILVLFSSRSSATWPAYVEIGKRQ